MSIQRRRTRSGIRYRFVKMIRGTLLWSPAIYLSRDKAEEAEEAAARTFLETGTIPSDFTSTKESVKKLLERRVLWLRDNRGNKHAFETENAFKRSLFYTDWLELPAESITPEMVSELKKAWGDDLRSRGRGMSDFNKTLGYLQTAWNGPWDNLRAKREYPENPFAQIERHSQPRRAKRYPTDKQVKSILEQTEGEKRLFLEVVVETAARPGEALTMKWEDVFIDERPFSLLLWTSKKRGGSRSSRRITIKNALAVRLRNWRARNKSALFVFQQEGRTAGDEAPRVARWYANLQRDACAVAKVPYFNPHCYRHYRASKLVKMGKTLLEVQNFLGHEDSKTTTIYLHDLTGT